MEIGSVGGVGPSLSAPTSSETEKAVNARVEHLRLIICNTGKTENGLRKVPIADKVLPFYKAWYEGSQCEYLLHTPDQKHFDYRNYYDSYFTPLMEQLGYDQAPHCTRHPCISMLTEAHADQTMIKKIAGHSGAMTLTERVYTHLDIETLVEAINKI